MLIRFVGCILLSLTGGSLFAADPVATPADQIRTPKGFQAELLYTVPAGQGSWVSMTTDPQGRLLVSDQYGSLYRVTVGTEPSATEVEKLNVEIGSAQGLLCAFDSLYVVVNGQAAEGAGLYRVRDTNGDDQYDTVELLRKFAGGGEHGPHAVVLSPDGESLYIAAGNHTELPEPEKSRVPLNWAEDQLLPRMWDAGGHAVGRMAPGGWICRTDPDGKTFELISSGYRNEYDIAFSEEGELFTYDADMEWDIGSPWYRPTRVCHVTSGSEFGWRSGTGKWPEYYPDSLPAAVDIGPGSPTGICFGTGAHFPEKYQRALFIADWSYGLIYAVHLTPEGSSYSGEFEEFATAAPLPVTDMVVRPSDGALYFAIGGRRTQSALYRIRYRNSDDAPEDEELTFEAESEELRALRHRLETLHEGDHEEAVEKAWPHLGHSDRFVRYAARIALEHQPVETWQDRALGEDDPEALITAMVALARCGESTVQARMVTALRNLDWEALTEEQQLSLLRAYGLTFIRMGEPSETIRDELLAQVDPRFPSNSARVNRELGKLLIYLEAPNVAARTVDLMAAAPTQEAQLDYALALRSLRSTWTTPVRRQYFSWFQDANRFSGGHSFSGFIKNIHTEAVAALSDREKEELKDVIEVKSDVQAVATPARDVVRQWTVDDLLADVDGGLHEQNYQRGRQVFAAAECFKCHRFAGEGGIIGPDLTGVGRRFDNRYLLESLIEPSKAVSDQYQASMFILNDGKTVVGKVANLNGDQLMVITNMLEPGRMTSVKTDEIDETQPSPVSMMPKGLLDTFEKQEILDLMLFLKSGGKTTAVSQNR